MSRSAGVPSNDSVTSATRSRIEFVPQSMAATRDMRLPYGSWPTSQPPLVDYDPLACDPALTAALAREGAGDALPALKHLAALVTSEEAQEHARLADVHPPVLHTHDRYGAPHRRGRVPPVLALADAPGRRLRAARRAVGGRAGLGRARARGRPGFYLMGQLESGHCCPISMTYAAVPALRHDPGLAAAYEPGLRSTTYAFGLSPPATKAGLLAGHVDDREAGRLGRAGEHHARGAVARRAPTGSPGTSGSPRPR